MKIKNLVWLISLLMIVPCGFVSCNDDGDDDPQKEEGNDEKKENEKLPDLKAELPTDPNTAVVKLLVLNEYNIPQKTTVYMSDKENADWPQEALTYEDTDENGIVKFIINAEDLNGNYNKKFKFYTYNNDKVFDDGNVIVAIKAGEGKTDTIIEPEKLVATRYVLNLINVKINKDLSVTISTQLHFNYKIQSLTVKERSSDNVVYDFIKENKELSDKIDNLPESRRITEVIEDSIKLTTSNLPLNNYEVGGKIIEFVDRGYMEIGASKSYNIGAYCSFDQNQCYTLSEAKYHSIQCFSVSSEDGYNVIGLKKATLAKSTDVADRAEQVTMIQDGEYVDEVHEGGIIITEYNIYKIISINNSPYGDATIEYLSITKNNNREFFTLDLSEFDY